jgi:CDP-diacylglycerol---serine O-phosphatidyltransferase
MELPCPRREQGVSRDLAMRRRRHAESQRPRHFSLIRDFHLADVLTLANGASGTAAIFLAMDHVREPRPDKIYAAALLVLGALFFDVMDGRIARWRHQASDLGRAEDVKWNETVGIGDL